MRGRPFPRLMAAIGRVGRPDEADKDRVDAQRLRNLGCCVECRP